MNEGGVVRIGDVRIAGMVKESVQKKFQIHAEKISAEAGKAGWVIDAAQVEFGHVIGCPAQRVHDQFSNISGVKSCADSSSYSNGGLYRHLVMCEGGRRNKLAVRVQAGTLARYDGAY